MRYILVELQNKAAWKIDIADMELSCEIKSFKIPIFLLTNNYYLPFIISSILFISDRMLLKSGVSPKNISAIFL